MPARMVVCELNRSEMVCRLPQSHPFLFQGSCRSSRQRGGMHYSPDRSYKSNARGPAARSRVEGRNLPPPTPIPVPNIPWRSYRRLQLNTVLKLSMGVTNTAHCVNLFLYDCLPKVQA